MSKPWLGINEKVHEAVLYLTDYTKVIQRWQGHDYSRLVQSINIVLDELDRKHELNKRLNDEIRIVMKHGCLEPKI